MFIVGLVDFCFIGMLSFDLEVVFCEDSVDVVDNVFCFGYCFFGVIDVIYMLYICCWSFFVVFGNFVFESLVSVLIVLVVMLGVGLLLKFSFSYW